MADDTLTCEQCDREFAAGIVSPCSSCRLLTCFHCEGHAVAGGGDVYCRDCAYPCRVCGEMTWPGSYLREHTDIGRLICCACGNTANVCTEHKNAVAQQCQEVVPELGTNVQCRAVICYFCREKHHHMSGLFCPAHTITCDECKDKVSPLRANACQKPGCGLAFCTYCSVTRTFDVGEHRHYCEEHAVDCRVCHRHHLAADYVHPALFQGTAPGGPLILDTEPNICHDCLAEAGRVINTYEAAAGGKMPDDVKRLIGAHLLTRTRPPGKVA